MLDNEPAGEVPDRAEGTTESDDRKINDTTADATPRPDAPGEPDGPERPGGSGGPDAAGSAGSGRTRRRAATRPPGPPPEPAPEPQAGPPPGSATGPAAGSAGPAEGPEEGARAPVAVTFQPPVVVFQPPRPAPEPLAAEGPREAADDAADGLDFEDDDLADRPTRRRRRRGGRGRGKAREARDGDDGFAEDAGPESESDQADEIRQDRSGAERQAERGGDGTDKKADRKQAKRGDRKTDKGQKAEKAEKPDKADKGEKAERKSGKKGDRKSERRAAAKSAGAATATDASAEPSADEAGSAQEAAERAADDQSEGGTRRRRRRRRRADSADVDLPAPDDPADTVVHVREARAADDEVQAVRGSTRLEAKKQRRREGREQGRRRPPIITESEFLARRESVERVMVVRQDGDRTQIAVLEDNVLVEHYVDRASHQSYIGNAYLGKVQNVLPSMEAAFVDIGKGRNAVLYAGEVNWDMTGLEGQPKRIESALKSGQSVLVQVTKDPLGHKGARLTSQVSLPGRYLVYVPDASMTGISRKLPDRERSRLRQILKKVMPEDAGVIVRTAAEGASEEELARDVSRLAAQWESIKRKAKAASPPEMLYSEPDLTIRVVRDIFNEDFSRLVVSGDDSWDMVEEYVRYVAPHLVDRLEQWSPDRGRGAGGSGNSGGASGGDVFTAYRVDEQIAKALERKVWLPSGGSLVIDRTEAMTVIDVNTGKFTGQGGNLEETVTRNNLEAAEEIVRQLRLRDIGGIIVIDFIDMVLESNRELVLRRLLECLARDRTKHQVAEVTSLGLVQMTRKRVGQGLLEAFSETCECCNGRGIHVSATLVDSKPEKAGRRRKRKGDVERAVEEKISKAERNAEKAAEVAKALKAKAPAAGARSSAGAAATDPQPEPAAERPEIAAERAEPAAERPEPAAERAEPVAERPESGADVATEGSQDPANAERDPVGRTLQITMDTAPAGPIHADGHQPPEPAEPTANGGRRWRRSAEADESPAAGSPEEP
jgi:ribonuclease E